MKGISFIICTHSLRYGNLNQTLRLLRKREQRLFSQFRNEIVIVCQDQIPRIEGTHVVNLQTPDYNRPRMCNIGVAMTQYDLCVLLDSDRVLPEDYYLKLLNMPRGCVCSAKYLYQLCKPHSDEKILSGQVIKEEDFRSATVEPMKKNAFSGNTTIWRSDYQQMDESFIGYGFNDNDACQTAMAAGLELRLLDQVELHLYHRPLVTMDNNSNRENRLKTLEENFIRYQTKWITPQKLPNGP